MTQITRSAQVPYDATQMYRLVNDVAAYPLFLPWCAKTKVHSETAENMTATVHIEKGPLRQQFKTSNTLTPGERIQMKLLEGPFKYLRGGWRFLPTESGSQVQLELAFEFSNRLLDFALNPIFSEIAASMVSAFVTRAHEVYKNA